MNEFGHRTAGVTYVDRVCAYAIIRDRAGAIALVRTRKGYFLPGGGVDPGETIEQALRREILEETGYASEILGRLGVAAQHLYDGERRVYVHKIGHFRAVTLEQKLAEPVEKDHELVWIRPDESLNLLTHEYQAWAVRQSHKIPN